MNLFGEFFQEQRIRETQKEAQRANEKAVDATSTTLDLRKRVDGLALANQALFEILQLRLGISEEEVLQRMAEIDGRDGVRDGKMAACVVPCRSCGRKVSTARQRCMYCGSPVADGHLFEKI
jgi:hypothetical protein